MFRASLEAQMVQKVFMHAKSLQSCPALCDPMDHRPPGSSAHGLLQAKILHWVACPAWDLSYPVSEPPSLMSPVWQVGNLPLGPQSDNLALGSPKECSVT